MSLFFQLTLPCSASVFNDLFNFISFHFTLFYFVSLHFMSLRSTSFHFASLRLTSFHFVSFHFTSAHLRTRILQTSTRCSCTPAQLSPHTCTHAHLQTSTPARLYTCTPQHLWFLLPRGGSTVYNIYT